MHWQRLQARVEKHQLSRIESVLTLAGATAISLLDAKDQPLLEPAPGTTPVWDHLVIEALFPPQYDLGGFSKTLEQLGAQAIRINALQQQDWVARSEALDQPQRFGSHLWVIPETHQPVRAMLDDERRVEVVMVPGLAFGSGLHPTTGLCLEWLDGNPPEKKKLLDFGCGSGILGIAGLKLGARAASLVDLDPQAVAASRHNAERNQVLQRAWIGTPDELPEADFDVLIANILANPLRELAERFAQLVVRGGDVVLTGLLDNQAAALIDTYDPWFSDWVTARRDGWLRLHGKRSSHS